MLIFKQKTELFPPIGIAGFKLSDSLMIEISDGKKSHTFQSTCFNVSANSIINHLKGHFSKWKFLNTVSYSNIYDGKTEESVFVESKKGFIFEVEIRHNVSFAGDTEYRREFYTDDAFYWELPDGTKGLSEESLKDEIEAKEKILIKKFCKETD